MANNLISDRIPELLLPAGSPEKMRYAYAYGADAVYAGVPIFSLRARENEFSRQSLADAISYSHERGKKIYLTMNIYAHNSKVERFLDTFVEMVALEPDGFIMADAGLIHKARSLCPDAIIHVSTQSNVTNWAAAQFWADMGAKRIILPRELSLREIATISEKVPSLELESFVHGAICIAYSGRCLISNYINHRDANQGTCTNSCRWEYQVAHQKESLLEVEQSQEEPPMEHDKRANAGTYYLSEMEHLDRKFEVDEDENGTYLMNSKDLCAIELLDKIANSGVCSFKVEGRTKSLYYTAVVARAYRRALDDLSKGLPFNPDNLREVMSTANRTLMTGFYEKRPQKYGTNYSDGYSQPLTHRYAGQLKSYDSSSAVAWVNFKNKVVPGDTLEWLSPRETISAEVTAILKENGSRADSAHGGCCFGIPLSFEPDEMSLIRIPIEQPRISEEPQAS